MSDKPSTPDRADSATEAEQRMCAALGFRAADTLGHDFVRAFREAAREQVHDALREHYGHVLQAIGDRLRMLELASEQRDNAPHPAALPDYKLRAPEGALRNTLAGNLDIARMALDGIPHMEVEGEKEGKATGGCLVCVAINCINAAIQQHVSAPQPAAPDDGKVPLRVMAARLIAREHEGMGTQPSYEDFRVADAVIALLGAQPAPVAQGDSLDWLVTRLWDLTERCRSGHLLAAEANALRAQLAREIHAHYERRAAQQREIIRLAIEQDIARKTDARDKARASRREMVAECRQSDIETLQDVLAALT